MASVGGRRLIASVGGRRLIASVCGRRPIASVGGRIVFEINLGLRKLDKSIDKAGDANLCTNPQFLCAELLVVIGLGFIQSLDLCKIIDLTVLANKTVIFKNVKRVFAEVHTTLADHCTVFLKYRVLCVLLATANQAVFKSFVAFHNSSK